MSNITDWIKNELYPSLFESIDRALPELEFRKQGYKWISSLKLDLSKPKTPRADKTVVSSKAPGAILENGSTAISLVDYVMSRDNVSFIDAVKTLAQVVNLQLPKGDIDQNSYSSYKERANILEDCNSYFMYCLWNSPGAQDVRDYLSSRGYSSEDIKTMELGFIPSQEKLYTYLRNQKHKEELIDEIKLNKAIGEENKLSIPYRSSGSITGFIFRTIEPSQTNKYMNSTGLERSKTLFNMKPAKGDKDIVIVEGFLDALISDARGVDNVVALGGVNLSTEQIRHAISKGAKKFTLCLDRDKAGAENTLKAIDLIVAEGISRVYVATLPEIPGTKTDPDSLIKERGVEALKEAIREAIPYYEYKLLTTLNKYGAIEEERGLQPKDIDSLLDEVVTTATNIQDVIDRDRYKTLFTSLDQIKELGIKEDNLDLTVDRLTTTRDKENQAKDFKKLLSEATTLQGKGEIDKALELLDSKVKEVKLKDKTTEFSILMKPIKEDELKERLSNKPDSLNSGYTIGGEPLLLPSGAISVFSAPTSHGKTTLLINTALNVAQAPENKDKEIYLFSFEEDSDTVLMNALNIYQDEEISSNNRRTLRSYFTTGSTEYVRNQSKGYFTTTKDRFFRELIDTKRLNIHYTNYNSDTLIDAIRYLHKHAKPGAIFIDYIQLLNLPEGKYKTYSRQEEMKEICIALKDVAVETGLPIILGAQFNREVVNQLRIHATKIGEAGDIERIANLIVGFWNNNFKQLGTEAELKEIDAIYPDTIYSVILKNRGGRVGLEERLSFNGNTGKIKNRATSESIVSFK